MDIAHFAFGGATTTLVVTYLVPTVWNPRTVVMVGGGWAMVPDIHHISPVFAGELHLLHGTSPRMDVFWLHRSLDILDPTDSRARGALLLTFFIATTMLAERRGYRAPATVRAAYGSSIDSGRPEDEA